MKHKSEGGGEPDTPAPTSITNHAYQEKEHVCTQAAVAAH